MRNAKHVFIVLIFATIGALTACMMPIEEATETSVETSDTEHGSELDRWRSHACRRACGSISGEERS
jgi:hypothetical protein